MKTNLFCSENKFAVNEMQHFSGLYFLLQIYTLFFLKGHYGYVCTHWLAGNMPFNLFKLLVSNWMF